MIFRNDTQTHTFLLKPELGVTCIVGAWRAIRGQGAVKIVVGVLKLIGRVCINN